MRPSRVNSSADEGIDGWHEVDQGRDAAGGRLTPIGIEAALIAEGAQPAAMHRCNAGRPQPQPRQRIEIGHPMIATCAGPKAALLGLPTGYAVEPMIKKSIAHFGPDLEMIGA